MIKKIRYIIAIIILLVAGIVLAIRSQNKNALPTGTVSAPPVSGGVNTVVDIPVSIDSKTVAINAAEVYVTFDPAELEIESVDTTGSFFTLWITDHPKFSNREGTLVLAGGLPTPGHTGNGLVATIKAKILTKGRHTLQFTEQSRILINDGLGTQQPLTMPSIRVTGK